MSPEIKPKSVRIGYGKYKDKYEAEDAEINAWLSLPLEERKRIMKENREKELAQARSMGFKK